LHYSHLTGGTYARSMALTAIGGIGMDGNMRTLLELLPAAEGSEAIRRCWGDVPSFAFCEVLHMKQALAGDDEQKVLMTAVFVTNESENANECKPSKMTVEFSGVSYWEYDSAFAEANGIRLDAILRSPPSGSIAIAVEQTFYFLCRSFRVLSCVHEPFGNR
jgi:hypothetical protein